MGERRGRAEIKYKPGVEEEWWRFDPESENWITVSSSSSLSQFPQIAEELRVVTWNVWFSEHRWKQRLDMVVQEIADLHPKVDVICLQEVTFQFAKEIRKISWIRSDFLCSLPPEKGSYGTLMLARQSFPSSHLLRFSLQSHFSRDLLVAVPVPHSQMPFICTSHLESLHPHSARRINQLETIALILRDLQVLQHPTLTKETSDDQDWQRGAVLMGDFNFHSLWPENQVLVQHFVDLWSFLEYPEDQGFTEDTFRNRMRLEATGKAKQVRFDRIVSLMNNASSSSSSPSSPSSSLSFGETKVLAKFMKLMGTEEKDGVWASDHFGLLADLLIGNKKEKQN